MTTERKGSTLHVTRLWPMKGNAFVVSIILVLGCASEVAFAESVVPEYASESVPKVWVGSWSAPAWIPRHLGPESLASDKDVVDNYSSYDPNPTKPALVSQILHRIHLSAVSSTGRVRLSNVYSGHPAHIRNVVVGRALDKDLTDVYQTVTFSGHQAISIAPGSEAVSDPFDITDAISGSHPATIDVLIETPLLHPFPDRNLSSWDTVWGRPGIAFGNAHNTVFGLPWNKQGLTGSTLGLAGVDVLVEKEGAGTIVFMGDSITEGWHHKVGTSGAWPDVVAKRIAEELSIRNNVGVLNQGISSAKLLSPSFYFFSFTHVEPIPIRLKRDALRSDLKIATVVVAAGINDLRGSPSPRSLVGYNKQGPLIKKLLEMRDEAAAAGVECFVVAKIYPSMPGTSSTDMEDARQDFNELLDDYRHEFGAVLDFEDALKDKQEAFFVDGLHPSAYGHQKIANSIDLKALLPPPLGNCGQHDLAKDFRQIN